MTISSSVLNPSPSGSCSGGATGSVLFGTVVPGPAAAVVVGALRRRRTGRRGGGRRRRVGGRADHVADHDHDQRCRLGTVVREHGAAHDRRARTGVDGEAVGGRDRAGRREDELGKAARQGQRLAGSEHVADEVHVTSPGPGFDHGRVGLERAAQENDAPVVGALAGRRECRRERAWSNTASPGASSARRPSPLDTTSEPVPARMNCDPCGSTCVPAWSTCSWLGVQTNWPAGKSITPWAITCAWSDCVATDVGSVGRRWFGGRQHGRGRRRTDDDHRDRHDQGSAGPHGGVFLASSTAWRGGADDRTRRVLADYRRNVTGSARSQTGTGSTW